MLPNLPVNGGIPERSTRSWRNSLLLGRAMAWVADVTGTLPFLEITLPVETHSQHLPSDGSCRNL
jgi:hypothetical protein